METNVEGRGRVLGRTLWDEPGCATARVGTSFFLKAEDPRSERAGRRGTDPTLRVPSSGGRSLGSGGGEQICCKPQIICCLREWKRQFHFDSVRRKKFKKQTIKSFFSLKSALSTLKNLVALF